MARNADARRIWLGIGMAILIAVTVGWLIRASERDIGVAEQALPQPTQKASPRESAALPREQTPATPTRAHATDPVAGHEPPRETKPDGNTAAIIGRVVTPDDAPVADARVGIVPGRLYERFLSRPRAIEEGDPVVRTAVDGRFRFELAEPLDGKRAVVVLPPAPYAPADSMLDEVYLARAPRELAQPQAPLDVGNVVVPLGGAVEGRVTDVQGRPVAQATVRLGGRYAPVIRNDGADRSLNTLRLAGPTTRTDAEGHYRLDGVPPGRDSVRAQAPGYTADQRDRVDVEAGETVHDVDFTLHAAPRLVVVVADRAGRPIEQAAVELRNQATRQTDAQGRAEFAEVRSLEVRLEVRARGYVNLRNVSLTLTEGEATVHEVSLRQATMISVRPIDADTGQAILAPNATSDVMLRFRQNGSTLPFSSSYMGVDEDGTLYHESPPIGESVVTVWPNGFGLHEEELSLREQEHRHLGDIPFTRGTRFLVEVRRPTGEPIVGMNVGAWSQVQEPTRFGDDDEDVRRGPSAEGKTDENGQWETPVIGGTHARFVFWRALYESDFGRHLTAAAEHVERIDPSQELIHIQVELDLSDEPASVRGVARDADGRPLAEREIYLVRHYNPDRPPSMTMRTTTDEQGNFHFKRLGAGRYRLTIRPGRPLPEPDDSFEVRDGEQVERDYSLVDDVLHGTLLWHNGAAAANVPIVAVSTGEAEPGETTGTTTDAQGKFALLEPYDRDDQRSRYVGMVRLRVEVDPGRFVFLGAAYGRSHRIGELRLPPLDADSRGQLTIRVLDAVTKAPVSAPVRVFGRIHNEHVVRSLEVDGTEVVNDLPAGELRITMNVPDRAYISQQVEVVGGEAREVILQLAASASAYFRVTMSDDGAAGTGSPSIRVRAEPQAGGTTRSRAGRPGQRITITRLAAGTTYVATVRCEGYAEQTVSFVASDFDEQGYEITLTPSVGD